MKLLKHPYVRLAAKLLFTVAALYVVFLNVPLQDIIHTLSSAQLIWLVPATLLFIVSKLFSAIRLHGLCAWQQIPVPKEYNLRLYWLGMFYNFLLPGGIGGDGYKVYKINKDYSYPLLAIGRTLLLDRVSGLAALCNLAGILYLFISPSAWVIPCICIQILFNTGYVIGLSVFFSKNRMQLTSEGLSWLVQLAQLACTWCLLQSLHLSGYTLVYLFVFLLSSIASAFPLSIGGLGAREFTFLWAASFLPVEKEKAVCIGLLFYLLSLLVASWGAVYLIRSIYPTSNSYAKP